MVFNAVLGLCFDFVEQLIVFVLDILDQFFSVMEFDIMGVIVFMMLFIDVEMVKASMFVMLTFPVSMSTVVAIGMVSGNWLVDSMVRIEVRLMLNAMDIMVCFMPWVELVAVRVVVVSSVSMISNIVVSVMEIIEMCLMVWSFMMRSFVVDYMGSNGRLTVHFRMEIVMNIVMNWHFMMLFVMIFMMNGVSWMISIMVMLVSSHFTMDIVDLVRKIMIIMMVVFMINYMAFNHFMMTFMSIVILWFNMVEFWFGVVFMFMMDIVEVWSMLCFMVVMTFCMMIVVVVLMVRFMMDWLFMVGLVVIFEMVVLVLKVTSISIIVSTMFTIVNMSIVIVSSFVPMNVPWSVFVVVFTFVMATFVHWSEIVVSMSLEVINNWSIRFMVFRFRMFRLVVFLVFHQCFYTKCSMRPSFTVTRIRGMSVIMSCISPVAFSVVWVFPVMWVFFMVFKFLMVWVFPNTIEMMLSAVSIVHFWVEIWFISTMPVMMIVRVAMSPVVVSEFSMMRNIMMLVTWEMLLSSSIMMISWLTSHWSEVSWVV